MEENTQRDHGSKAQEWGSKESKERAKKGENGQYGAPGRHLGAILGAITERRRPGAPCWVLWCPRGARGRHLGTDSAANFSFREIRVSTPYISFLTPPNLRPSSPRSKIPSSLRVSIIPLNPNSNPPHSTPNLPSFLSYTTISTPFLPPTFSNLHLHPWQHPWMSLGFHLLWVAKHSWVFGDEKMVQSFMGFIGEFILFHALSLYIWDMWLQFLVYFG